MPKKRSKFQSKVEEIAVRLAIGSIGLFPYQTSLRFGKFVGRTVIRIFPNFAKTANRNLEIAFPDISPEEKNPCYQCYPWAGFCPRITRIYTNNMLLY